MVEKDLLVYKQITHKGISVIIEVDYLEKRMALVEYNGSTKQYKPKNWQFSMRGQEYLGGWLLIMEAMEKAVRVGNDMLETRKGEDMKKLAQTLYEVQKLEKTPIRSNRKAKK